jgi:hypothetical protein
MTRLLCRWMDRWYNPLYCCYGVHELCVRRKGSSLQFRRWSVNRMHPTLWMALFFKTWESMLLVSWCFPTWLSLIRDIEMVLFHSAFGALKSRSPLTINITPDDVVLAGEKRLFQGYLFYLFFDPFSTSSWAPCSYLYPLAGRSSTMALNIS